MNWLNKMDNNISDIHAGQDQMGNCISAIKEEIKTDISAIRSGQEGFEEKTTHKLEKQLKGVENVVEQHTQKFRDEFNNELQETRRDITESRQDKEAT
jgi:gas vesicle protein